MNEYFGSENLSVGVHYKILKIYTSFCCGLHMFGHNVANN